MGSLLKKYINTKIVKDPSYLVLTCNPVKSDWLFTGIAPQSVEFDVAFMTNNFASVIEHVYVLLFFFGIGKIRLIQYVREFIRIII